MNNRIYDPKIFRREVEKFMKFYLREQRKQKLEKLGWKSKSEK